jgi:hypothetical protein
VDGPVAVRLHLDREEQRRLALRYLLHGLRGVGVALRQLRQLPGQLEQQLQPVPRADLGELLDQLGELRRQRHADPRSLPMAIGTRTVLPHSVQLPS